MLVSIVLMRLNQNTASPPLLIADRWLRWLIFAVGGAYIATEYELVHRPFWVLAVAFFLTWFLLVTLYDWLAISAHSVSPLPLFPSYSVNSSGDEWPVRPRLLRTREWLRSQGFRPLQALKAEIGGGIHLRTSIYQDTQAMMRVQVSFIPHGSGGVAVCHAVSSVTADGTRLAAPGNIQTADQIGNFTYLYGKGTNTPYFAASNFATPIPTASSPRRRGQPRWRNRRYRSD